MGKTKNEVNIRGHHLPNLIEYLRGSRQYWTEKKGYTRAFAVRHDEVLKDIVDNPDITVNVIAGMDCICHCGACPNISVKCSSPELDEKDRENAVKYGTTVGSSFKSSELVKRMRRYTDTPIYK